MTYALTGSYDSDAFYDLVQAADWWGAEDACRHVSPEDTRWLVEYYWTLDDWQKRVALVNLLWRQDLAEVRPVMIDVLRVPLVREGQADMLEIVKIQALAFVDERYDTFQRFYDDRELLAETVDRVLREHGLRVEEPPVTEPEQPAEPGKAAEAAGEPEEPAERLRAAVERGDAAAVLALLDGGLDVDHPLSELPDVLKLSDDQDPEWLTPLLLACIEGHRELADLLVGRGADVRASRAGGQTPLYWAAVHGWLPTVNALLERGADPDARDHWGATPLRKALGMGHIEVARRLVDVGADLTVRDTHDYGLMYAAATQGGTAGVELLLDRGLDIDRDCGSGRAPLAVACHHNHLELVETLLARGAGLEVRDQDGRTPLMVAARGGYPRIVTVLLAAGADRAAKDPDGRTAADLAGGRRKQEVRHLLG
ncbi:hypothetical protein GCM10010517_62430 [Streptosporangium fragile]|uniref:Ankyrin repeat domain-containing protein n=1 Tax=Streptosporangium fragile TaxID=46186 RepID=A0ABP6ILU0_9ACTN